MVISFQHIKIHNFLSFGDAEIDFTKRGYCLIKGINKCPTDKASANGVGKSALSSAICWALTGETIKGISSDLKNRFVAEDSCYVSLTFYADKDFYEITRIKNPKSDMKISLNGSDISGKGIKESEAILKAHLPDITRQLLASIIILGQGLPEKFTANTPSKRKEILEKLSKSDFMIEDIKQRIAKRQSDLTADQRKIEDKLLAAKSKLTLLEAQYASESEKLSKLQPPDSYDALLPTYETQLLDDGKAIEAAKIKINDSQSALNSIGMQLNEKLQAKSAAIMQDTQDFSDKYSKLNLEKSQLGFEILALDKKIREAKNIKDICPTCGQKLPNVHIVDTSADEVALGELQQKQNHMAAELAAMQEAHSRRKAGIEKDYDLDTSLLNSEYKKAKDTLEIFQKEMNMKTQHYNQIQAEKNKILAFKQSFEQIKQDLEKRVSEFQIEMGVLTASIAEDEKVKNNVIEHINTINQINTFVKRDFRGILLENLIAYIQQKAREYSSKIFGTDNLVFMIDGNNIDITYCGKPFENLSGGEEQKVDIIIQFAIRDMMEKYLNFSSNILVLDEIFDALDSISCTSVVNLISEKLNDVESIFVISHRADELDIPCDCQIVIEKNKKGVSSIIQGG